MFNRKFLFVFLINVFMLFGVSQTVFAGGMSITSLTGDCYSITVLYTSTASSIDFVITNLDTGAQLDTVSGLAPNGTYTLTFSKPLSKGTTVEVKDPNFGVTDTLLISSCSAISSSEPLIQMCADGRTNTNLCDPLAIYPVESDDGTGMVIYRIPRDSGDIGEFEVYISAEDLDSLPDKVDKACTIAASDDGYVVVYLLDTGEIQVNTGPDEENKFFVFRYENFPEVPQVETYVGTDKLPTSPSCWDDSTGK